MVSPRRRTRKPRRSNVSWRYVLRWRWRSARLCKGGQVVSSRRQTRTIRCPIYPRLDVFQRRRCLPKNYHEAYVWLSLAAKNGAHIGAKRKRDLIANKLSPADLSAAQKEANRRDMELHYRRYAEQGDAYFQELLGHMYYAGDGVPQDYAKALKWLRRAAEQGWIKSQKTIGLMHYNGRGVPQNYYEAYVWLSVAVANGDVTTMERDIVGAELSPTDLSSAQKEATRRHAEIQSGKDK